MHIVLLKKVLAVSCSSLLSVPFSETMGLCNTGHAAHATGEGFCSEFAATLRLNVFSNNGCVCTCHTGHAMYCAEESSCSESAATLCLSHTQ